MITAEKNRTDIKSRIICHIKGKESGPTIVFFAGIHGNEPAGVQALKNTVSGFKPDNVKGDIYGIYGNSEALKVNKRFIDSDLNRIWTSEKLGALSKKKYLNTEEIQQVELYNFLNTILKDNHNPIYFIDFHTTSSKTLPFITINDALVNRKFSGCFPVPIVLGIEEYLEGPLLSYLNKLGYVSLGFEAGQHEDKEAVSNCESFIYLAAHYSGVSPMKKEHLEARHKKLLKASKNVLDVFEVIFKYHIKPNESFVMERGFESFQNITKGTVLAHSNSQPVYAAHNQKLFMPLYQNRGNDGFFIIRTIPSFFLKLSAFLRRIKADNILTVLPGITWHNKPKGVLRANLKVTRFMAKSIFHLLGYRNKQQDKTHLLLYNRERVARNFLYKDAFWNTTRTKSSH